MNRKEVDFKRLRKEYRLSSLEERTVPKTPFSLFERWLKDATKAEMLEPNAMCLATVDGRGRPSARMVLLKEYGEDGFVFFTNYASRKGKELEKNPNATLVFYWDKLERQIRIDGKVKKVLKKVSEQYFATRPRGAKIGAVASKQSKLVSSREVIEDRIEAIKKKYDQTEIPRPANWGGYILKARVIEFWQGREVGSMTAFNILLVQESGALSDYNLSVNSKRWYE